MPPRNHSESYWADVWADPNLAQVILQHGRIFAITQRNFLRGLHRHLGPLTDKRVLDFGCGDGLLLAPLHCRERLLYEPSPVYTQALTALAAKDQANHATSIVSDVADIADTSLDLVIIHGVAHYMTRDELGTALRQFRMKLCNQALGVVVADLPHANRLIDMLGAVFANPTTIAQTLGQVARLARSRYASDRIERHSIDDLKALAAGSHFRLRRLNSRSFNRARSTVLLEPV